MAIIDLGFLNSFKIFLKFLCYNYLLSQKIRCFYVPTTLYFVSPRERPWRQHVVQNSTLVIARVTSVFSHAFKRNPRIDAQMMRFAAFILRRAEWRHSRSRDETKYRLISCVCLDNNNNNRLPIFYFVSL